MGWCVLVAMALELAEVRLGSQVSTPGVCIPALGLFRVLKSYIDLWPLYVQFTPLSSGICSLSPAQTSGQNLSHWNSGARGWVAGGGVREYWSLHDRWCKSDSLLMGLGGGASSTRATQVFLISGCPYHYRDP